MDNHNFEGQIHNSMYQNIQKKGVVAPVDVLMDIGVLSKQDYENWRYGRVVFLENVCKVNLHRLSDIMKEIRLYAVKNNLKSSWTFYHQWGKHKDRKLRFSKSNDEKIERSYATHFVDVKKIEELKHKPTEPTEK